MSWAIQTYNLSKQFPVTGGWRQFIQPRNLAPPAVDTVNITVKRGELFGLLGPNGAGKTTLIKMLSTLVIPTSGTAKLFDIALEQEADIRSMIGLVTSDERSFYWRLSGRENLEFFSVLHGLDSKQATDRIKTTLHSVGLQNVSDKRFQTYSSGMRQRLAIARALLSEPRLLFLDEPSRGLDPGATQSLHQLLRNLAADCGITVFLTTHNLDEAEQLCEHMAIMDKGRIRAQGTLSELHQSLNLRGEYNLRIKNFRPRTNKKLQEDVQDIQIDTLDTEDNEEASLIVYDSINGEERLNRAVDILREDDVTIMEIRHRSSSLKNIFIRMVDREDDREGSKRIAVDNLSVSSTTMKPHKLKLFHLSFPNRSDFRVTLAFLKKDWRIETSYRISFILQFIGIFFSVSLFYFIALLFGDAADPYLGRYGTDYFSFVLVGIAFSNYFGVGLSSFSSRIRQAQTTGTLEAMLTTPTKHTTIVISSSLWEYLMTTLRVFVYLAIGVIFMGVTFKDANYASASLVLLLSIISFSSLGIIAASFILVLKRGDPITWIVSSISSLLGGVYYPINVLPEGLRWLAMLLPITYSLDAMRLALLQGESIGNLLPQLMALSVFCVVLVPAGIIAFRYAVRKAKTDGSLTQY